MRRFSAPVVLYGCLALAIGCAPSSGDTGTAGNNGAAGTTGNGGTTGIAGTSGAAGNTGSAGSSGDAGSTGTAGNGGSTGTAGTVATAGTTGSGGRGGGAGSGSAGRGGTTGSAGTTGTAGSAAGTTGTAGAGGSGSCTITATSALSTKIATVGIVTWTTTLAGASSAKIDFGLTTSYGLSAPVSSVTASNRTLLLGMKAAKMYHYRVTAMAGGSSCQSQDYTIMTGNLASGLAKPTLAPATATGLFGGFLITGQYVQGAGAGATAYILDADGDYVWWYSIGSDVTGARMSYDGNYMWINSANVPSGTAHVRRVSMDGMTENDYSSQFTGLNHQLTILPDETVAFYAYSSSSNCDDIKERSPAGTVKTIANSGTALKQTSACHVNNIQYSESDNTLVFSDLDHTQIAKVKRSDGSTVWIMNGPTKTLTGDTWAGGEHGIHIIDPTHYLIFNNNSVTGNTGSVALEMQLDSATAPTKAMKIWSYTASPAQMNMVMGDVQRMSNGNTIVGYSTRGILHEVDSTGKLLQTWTFNNSFGYIEKRPSLYGPPPK
jgi:hypothetical protein